MAGAEIAILQAGIDVGADGYANSAEELPREAAVAVSQLLDPGDTDAAPEESVDAIIRTHVDQAVDHAREDAHVTAGIEIAGNGSGARFSGDHVQQVVGDEDAMMAGTFVAELTLDPEHAEVVTGIEVDVVTRLVPDPDRPTKNRVRVRGVREVDVSVGMTLQREESPEIGADVTRAVTCGGRRGDGRRSNGGKQIFAHVLNPFQR